LEKAFLTVTEKKKKKRQFYPGVETEMLKEKGGGRGQDDNEKIRFCRFTRGERACLHGGGGGCTSAKRVRRSVPGKKGKKVSVSGGGKGRLLGGEGIANREVISIGSEGGERTPSGGKRKKSFVRPLLRTWQKVENNALKWNKRGLEKGLFY